MAFFFGNILRLFAKHVNMRAASMLAHTREQLLQVNVLANNIDGGLVFGSFASWQRSSC